MCNNNHGITKNDKRLLIYDDEQYGGASLVARDSNEHDENSCSSSRHLLRRNGDRGQPSNTGDSGGGPPPKGPPLSCGKQEQPITVSAVAKANVQIGKKDDKPINPFCSDYKVISPTNANESSLIDENNQKDYIMKITLQEIDRYQQQHHVFRTLWNGNYSSPVGDILKSGDANVLDVGCGPGTWVCDMASEYKQQWNTFILQGGWIELEDAEVVMYNRGPAATTISDAVNQILRSKSMDPNITQKFPQIMSSTKKLGDIYHQEKTIPCGSWGGLLGNLTGELTDSFYGGIKRKIMDILNCSESQVDELLNNYANERSLYRTYSKQHRYYAQKLSK
ncbi:8963_t:CDS:10 [Entrophospora sp. SA101]|nr:8963_t:CDS:10 [Entrophospora sp. SA101]